MLTRRAFWSGASASAFVSSLPASVMASSIRNSALKASSVVTDRGTLKYQAARVGLLFGTFFDWPARQDSDYVKIVLQECSLIYPWGLSTNVTRHSATRFDFDKADNIIALAVDNGLALGGGYLVVHGLEPSWISASTERSVALAELQIDVATPIRRYKSKFDHWVVVNEAVHVEDGNAFGLRSCAWQASVGGTPDDGTDYVSEAFKAARAADPEAVLVLNENELEGDRPMDERKRAAVLDLLRAMRRNRIPIDGLGIQAHLLQGGGSVDTLALGQFFSALEDLDLKIYVTELDVVDAKLPADLKARDVAVSDTVVSFLKTALDSPALQSINVWGIGDGHSWYNLRATPESLRRADTLTSRGTLFDQALKPKPVFDGVLATLRDSSRKRVS